MPQNYKIILSYDGTDYHGWQIQTNQRTIQGTLEAALYRFRSARIPVMGAGRTDAGVHALGQAAHFQCDLGLSDAELLQALNGQLPPDIRIASLERAAPDFHARRSADSKVYRYRIIQTSRISPFDVRYALHRPGALNISHMKQAAKLFIREADFTAFSSNRLLHPVRRVIRSEIRETDDEITYTVEANGFLKYMVRTMMGTLLEVGKGRIQPGEITALFERRTRSLTSPTAPAKGLCLIRVKYPRST
jgi:tRNA pseudouridine38-40 synthase